MSRRHAKRTAAGMHVEAMACLIGALGAFRNFGSSGTLALSTLASLTTERG